MTSQPAKNVFRQPNFIEKFFDIKTQLKLWWRLMKDPTPGCFLKGLFWLLVVGWVFVGWPLYWILPDPIVGWVDDIFVAPWIVPYVLTLGYVALCPDWLVNYYRQKIQEENKPPDIYVNTRR